MPHFIGVLLGQAGGVELRHAPWRGSAPAVQDLLAGQIQAVSAPVGEFTQYVAAGKLRLLGTTGATRNRFAPSVPTFVEQGLKDRNPPAGAALLLRGSQVRDRPYGCAYRQSGNLPA